MIATPTDGPSKEQRAADRATAAKWAAEVLADPATVILDTETTGLHEAYIVQIAIASPVDRVLLDTLVKPAISIPAESSRIHGITDADVIESPSFPEILPQLTQVVQGKRVIIYNADFDTRIIRGEIHRRYARTHPNSTTEQVNAWHEGVRASWECAMLQYAAFCGDWNSYRSNYTWPKLTGGDHSALGDCRATWRTLKTMAASHSAKSLPPRTPYRLETTI